VQRFIDKAEKRNNQPLKESKTIPMTKKQGPFAPTYAAIDRGSHFTRTEIKISAMQKRNKEIGEVLSFEMIAKVRKRKIQHPPQILTYWCDISR